MKKWINAAIVILSLVTLKEVNVTEFAIAETTPPPATVLQPALRIWRVDGENANRLFHVLRLSDEGGYKVFRGLNEELTIECFVSDAEKTCGIMGDATLFASLSAPEEGEKAAFEGQTAQALFAALDVETAVSKSAPGKGGPPAVLRKSFSTPDQKLAIDCVISAGTYRCVLLFILS